jgi:hypothetical protein
MEKKMKIEVDDQMIQNVTDEICAKIDELLANEVDPLIISGILMAQSMQMYRTVLPEEDFQQFANELPKMAQQAKKWETGDSGPKIH